MIGHDSGKPGSWYEEEYVLLQLLRVLNAELRSVTWEVKHEDGEGIDCLLKLDEGFIAVQCKTRSTRPWTLRELQRKGVLAHAARHLESHPDRRFRFVSDAPCPVLKRICDEARSTAKPDEWWRGLKEMSGVLARAWELPQNAEAASKAHDLARRIEVRLLDAEGIKQGISGLAKTLSPDSGRLTDVLRQLARNSLTRELREPEVRRELERHDVSLNPRPADPAFHDRLKALQEGYVKRIEQVRGLLPLLERAEADRVVESLSAPELTNVLVHGPAGCGKSEIIAAAIPRLEQMRLPVLVLTPDMDADEIGLHGDPVGALSLYAAGKRAVLVIDQYDQVLLAGQETQRLLRRCHEWIRRAKELDVSVLVGARTAEAKVDTQLEALLGDEAQRIFIDDLDEAQVAVVLAREGIAFTGLDAPLRRLLRRPLALRLAIDLHRKGGALNGLRSLISLVDRWWNAVVVTLPGINAARAADALDGLFKRMEADGVLSVPSDGLRDPDAVKALVRAGILVPEIREGVEHLRPIHQVLADVRIALDWGAVRSAEDLLERLGPLESQSLHQARRLRLAVPLLLERPGGVGIVGEIVASDAVRPVLKQSVFLALAAVEQPDAGLVALVERWLDDFAMLTKVLPTVVRGQREWVRSLSESGWLDRAWKQHDSTVSKEYLIDILASVSMQWGDGVAKHLTAWEASEHGALELADHVFQSAPGDDSDALFELRIEYLARRVDEDPTWEWKPLLHKAPKRAVRLLEVLLSRGDVDVLTRNGPVWARHLPTAAELPYEVTELGRAVWDRLHGWWRRLELRDGLLVVPTARGGLEEGALARLVELLAGSLAHELARDPGFLEALLHELPSPLRELDGWLLLRTGARIPEHATKAADALAGWFMSEPRWAGIRVGPQGSAEPVEAFVRVIGTTVSDEIYRELEAYLIEHRDPWKRADEEERARWQKEYGMDVPSRIGRRAHRLLAFLPAERLSLRAQRRIGELRRKFGEPLPHAIVSGAFHIQSNVPDDVAGRWSTEEWLRRLRDPNVPRTSISSPKWTPIGTKSIGVYSLSELAAQLACLAARDPRRYLPLALELEPTDPLEVRERLLLSLCKRRRPAGLPEDLPWAPVEDEDVARIVLRPAYLDEPAAARLIAWVVSERWAYPWPETIREWLARTARGEVDAGVSENHGLAMYRLNEAGCAALEAIAALARNHQDLRPWALGIAAGVANAPDAGRRAGAGAIATTCLDENSPGAVKLLLDVTVDPLVAAEQEVSQGLYWLALAPADVGEHVRQEAVALLLAMAEHENEHVASAGGQAAVWLRHHGAIGDGELQHVLGCGTSVRRGMARVVQRLLIGQGPPPWLRELAVELVADTDRQTARTVLFAFLKPESASLLENGAFVRRLVTAAVNAGHDVGPLVRACDRQALLRPVAGIILSAANTLAWRGRHPGWETAHSLPGLLARLVEECEREGDFDLRSRALDAWDSLLEANVPLASRALATRLDDS